jgi:glycosyltransferase involved in cell wall biosynthesis
MVVVNLVNGARRSVIRHSVYCLDEQGDLGAVLANDGTSVRLLNRQTPRDWGLPRRLARQAREDRVDVIHAHNFTPFVYSTLSHILADGPPVVATFHNTRLASWGRRRRTVVRMLSQVTARTVAVSPQTRDVLAGMMGPIARRRLTCIANGVDVDRFVARPADARRTLRRELGVGEDVPLVGSVGRLAPEKDYATLVRAFAACKASHPAACLAIAGDGPDRSSLDSLVESLRLQSDVRLAGARADVERFLAALDVFVLSSTTEGTSIALLEAMASGLPVVATAVGGTVDLITHEHNGLLVTSADVPGIGHAISRMLSDRTAADQMGVAARQTAESRYSLRSMSDEYNELYRAACR